MWREVSHKSSVRSISTGSIYYYIYFYSVSLCLIRRYSIFARERSASQPIFELAGRVLSITFLAVSTRITVVKEEGLIGVLDKAIRIGQKKGMLISQLSKWLKR